jgi:hypothetical protein
LLLQQPLLLLPGWLLWASGALLVTPAVDDMTCVIGWQNWHLHFCIARLSISCRVAAPAAL